MSEGFAAPPVRRRDTILAAIEAFREESLPRSLTGLMLFLYICENEGLTVSELAHVARVHVAMAARIVKTMAGEAHETPLAPERVVFELRSSPEDKRLKLIYLAERGRLIRARLEQLIADAVPIAPKDATVAPGFAARTLERNHG
jgi:DNA-binding MarR family transcriptional regulator